MSSSTAPYPRDRGDQVLDDIDAATTAAGEAGKTAGVDPVGLEAEIRKRVPHWTYWQDVKTSSHPVARLMRALADGPAEVPQSWHAKWTTPDGEWQIGFAPAEGAPELWRFEVCGPNVHYTGDQLTEAAVLRKLDAFDVFPSASGVTG